MLYSAALAQPRAERGAVQHERLLAQLAQMQAAAPRQRVLGVQRHTQRLAQQHPGGDFGQRVVRRRADEADIDAPCQQLVDLHPRRLLAQLQFDLGPAAAEVAQQPRHRFGERHRAGEAQRQAAAGAGAGAARQLGGALQLLEQRARLRQQRGAGCGQLHAGASAQQQRHAEAGLERLDALRQRRLRQVQARRGAAEMAFVGDRDEGLQLADFHTKSISNTMKNRFHKLNGWA
ncbi:hypothetical protein GALL_431400 [mine drainage metagenome]|uniref:Uncharacterized protein n=1 Tax=mine drainage metagenome TaxID=410659 RepID=A0A1J5Q5C3_9ZZZZ